METTTRDNSTRHGLPVLRNRSGHEGASLLFTARRERQFGAGLLGETGNDGNYVLFRPSKFFGRILSDRVLQLNEALYHFRDEAADHILFLEGDKLQAYYDELDDWIEKVRDRLVVLTEYCNKGFDGRLKDALEIDGVVRLGRIGKGNGKRRGIGAAGKCLGGIRRGGAAGIMPRRHPTWSLA